MSNHGIPVHTPGYQTLPDQKALTRALKERWPIPRKEFIIEETMKCFNLPDDLKGLQLKLQATRNLIMMDKMNVDLIKAYIPQMHIHIKPEDLTDEQLEDAIKQILEVKLMEREAAQELLLEQEIMVA